MYIKKNDLKDALYSLSEEEHRYFYRYLKSFRQKRELLYIVLYEHIMADKSDFSFSKKGLSPQALTIAKRRLYGHLLVCLRQYNRNRSAQALIQDMLCEIEILYNLGLPAQSVVILKKAQSRARMHEKYGLLLHILEWERKLNLILNNATRSNDEIAEEEREVLRCYNEILELENIFGKVKEMKKKFGYVKGLAKMQLEEIVIGSDYFKKQYTFSSPRAKYYCHFILALYHWMIFDHKNAYPYSKYLLNEDMQHIIPDVYFDGILEHTTSCVCLGYFEEALDALCQASAFAQDHRMDRSVAFIVRMLYYESCYKLMMFNYMGDTDMLISTIAETERMLLQYDKHISQEMKLVIYGNLRNAYIGIGTAEKAESLLDNMLQRESRFLRGDVYNDLFLFRIFMLINSETYEVIPSVALSAQRHYRQHRSEENELEVELQIIGLLLKVADFTSRRSRKMVLDKIKNVLLRHLQRLPGSREFQEYYSFYILWVESMLRDSTFSIVASEWYYQFSRAVRVVGPK